jgi:hypothetical protein
VGDEKNRRLRIFANLITTQQIRLIVHDVAGSRLVGTADPYPVEMDELGGDASEVVPRPGQYLTDLFRRLFRERSLEIAAADTMLREPWPDVAHQECGERSDQPTVE